MMGEFTIFPVNIFFIFSTGIFNFDSSFKELPWIEYENAGDISGRYPVYYHNLTAPSPERWIPPRAFLYFYRNEIPDYPEQECRDRGCWIISKKMFRKFRNTLS